VTAAVDTPQPIALGKNTVPVAAGAIVEDAPRPRAKPGTPLVQVATATADALPDHLEDAVSSAKAPDGCVVNEACIDPATPPAQVATAAAPDAPPNHLGDAVSSAKTPDECGANEACIDQYLWRLYQRTPKTDAVKVTDQIKVTIKKNGKTRTVTKTVSKVVDEDFTWKDPKAAEAAGMALMEYVIGGMDRRFKLTLYQALRALDDAGFSPGITSGFRDDYRQSLASGIKAANDRSYHGGSRRGGYGHGLAADIVSVKGETRAERCRASETLWTWIDVHGKELGIGRPYRGMDPPHVAPIDGEEYAKHRRGAKPKVEAKMRHGPAARRQPSSNAQRSADASPNP
jgi:hypothetical protein